MNGRAGGPGRRCRAADGDADGAADADADASGCWVGDVPGVLRLAVMVEASSAKGT
ncbi:hypothetical protein Slala02_03880 [Streptomyces lavendulae subsp. lavendulae]|nr:hypothetical protein Slala01_12150 [Streptomyces lavendulae subsp. lavendulae]GLX24568.1 hypothetical protein Slala02_03880 [Streptomyces lavendulae subsp. lavendulae]